MTEKAWVVDDSLFKETTRELEAELRKRSIERSGPPDFDAIAARWKARQVAGEDAYALKTYRFVIIVHPENGQFRAYAPTLSDCEARGATPEEAKGRLLKALYVRLTEMLSGGQTPPSDEGAEIVNVVLPAPARETTS